MALFSASNQPTHKRTGRPKGSLNKNSVAINRNATKFIDLMFEKALDNDNPEQSKYAAIAARFIPAPKATLPEFSLSLNKGDKGDAKKIALNVAQCMANGDLSADVALSAIQVCGQAVGLTDVRELEKKIDGLLAARGLGEYAA